MASEAREPRGDASPAKAADDSDEVLSYVIVYVCMYI